VKTRRPVLPLNKGETWELGSSLCRKDGELAAEARVAAMLAGVGAAPCLAFTAGLSK
jgi:hypothetical protein